MSSQPPPELKSETTTETDKSDNPSPDVVLIQDVEPDGKGLRVLRYRDHQLEAGAVRPLEHGRPIGGELVRLKPRRELPIVCDVDVELPAQDQARGVNATARKKGPAQVATDRYRENWDRIWNRARSLPN